MNIETKNKLLNTLGSSVDNIFLATGRFLKVFKPRRNISRAEYEKQIAYYIDKGYTKNPKKFFSIPKKMPEYSIIKETPYRDGTRQVISYRSNYITCSPLLRDTFDEHIANKTGYLVRWTHGVAGRKTVLCMHGLMLGDPGQAERMFKIKKLYKMGLDVALFIAPFHWKRSHKSFRQKDYFLRTNDVPMTAECIRQSIHDLTGSFKILNDVGAGKIGIIGASLGGYISSIFISLTKSASFATLILPSVTFKVPFGPDSGHLPFPVDNTLIEKINRVWEFHSPLNLRPVIPKTRILLIAYKGDKLCPIEYTEKLCKTWKLPKYHILTGGHWLIFNKTRGKLWYKFLDEMGFLE